MPLLFCFVRVIKLKVHHQAYLFSFEEIRHHWNFQKKSHASQHTLIVFFSTGDLSIRVKTLDLSCCNINVAFPKGFRTKLSSWSLRSFPVIWTVSNLLVITSGTSRTELIIVNWEFHLPVFLFKISVAYILTYLEKFADIKMTIFNWFSLSSLLGTCVYKPCTSLGKFILQSNSNILKYCRRQRKKECKIFICGHDALKF